MSTIFIRTVIVYVILLASLKLMGKRQIGEVQLSEFVITLLIAELASYSVMDNDIPLVYVFVPIITLLAAEILLSYFGVRNKHVKSFTETMPCILIERGVIMQKRLENVRFTLNELISEVRLKGYADITCVDYAILESNGKLSVIVKTDYQPLTAAQFGLAPKQPGIMHPVIVNGELDLHSVSAAGRTPEWVMKAASDAGFGGVSEVYLMLVDNCGKIFTQKKEG